jgi:hypothetical protein
MIAAKENAMRSLAVAVVVLLLAGTVLAQTPPRQDRSRAGTVTNPPISDSVTDPGAVTATPEAPSSGSPEIHQPDTSVRQQAGAKRREALEHCQTLTGASRTDCVKRADDEFRRATGNDTLSHRGRDPSYG